MSSVSIYNPTAVYKKKPRNLDYNLIYKLKDSGLKNVEIKTKLKISEGTFRHAMMMRKKAANG